MAKLAIFLGYLANGVAATNLATKTYGDSTCSGDVKMHVTMPASTFLDQMAQSMGLQDVALGSCMNSSMDFGGFVVQMSMKMICNTTDAGDFFAIEFYSGSDSCDEAMLDPSSSQSGACTQNQDEQGENVPSWQAMECVLADTGNDHMYTMNMFSTQDCSDSPVMSPLYESGVCNPHSELEDGSWVAGSWQLTRSCGDSVTVELFDTDDCSGTATNTSVVPCGTCDATMGDIVTIGCPSAPACPPTSAPTLAPTSAPTSAPTPAPTSAPTPAPTSAPTQDDGEDDGVGNTDQSIQLSSGMAALVLLALQAL